MLARCLSALSEARHDWQPSRKPFLEVTYLSLSCRGEGQRQRTGIEPSCGQRNANAPWHRESGKTPNQLVNQLLNPCTLVCLILSEGMPQPD